MTIVLCGKNRDRKGERAPTWRPFYSRGNTWRGQHELRDAGWYFQDDRGVLSGPYATRLDCEHFIGEARGA